MGIACALCMLAVPCFIMLTNRDGHLEEKQSFCPFKMMTGMPCPGCGITKSFVSIYEGNFEKSFHYHLFGIPILLISACMVVIFAAEIATQKELFHNFLYSKKLAYACGITLAVYHIIRTIHFCMTHSLTQILQESIWM